MKNLINKSNPKYVRTIKHRKKLINHILNRATNVIRPIYANETTDRGTNVKQWMEQEIIHNKYVMDTFTPLEDSGLVAKKKKHDISKKMNWYDYWTTHTIIRFPRNSQLAYWQDKDVDDSQVPSNMMFSDRFVYLCVPVDVLQNKRKVLSLLVEPRNVQNFYNFALRTRNNYLWYSLAHASLFHLKSSSPTAKITIISILIIIILIFLIFVSLSIALDM